jgi:hypothetical protein
VARKVLSRHFTYAGGRCTVNVVVGEMDAAEYRSRFKE